MPPPTAPLQQQQQQQHHIVLVRNMCGLNRLAVFVVEIAIRIACNGPLVRMYRRILSHGHGVVVLVLHAVASEREMVAASRSGQHPVLGMRILRAIRAQGRDTSLALPFVAVAEAVA